MTRQELLEKANRLPDKPGVYTMYNAEKKVMYVGKAKNLKNRVTTYFRNGEQTEKTKRLVSNVDNFEVIITATEKDALLTECSLIRLHVPVYNIMLKYGKGYPYIYFGIENGFPVLRTETKMRRNGRYYGPFLSGHNAALIVKLLRRAYNLPECSLKKRKKVCLDYHIRRCPGYCVGKTDENYLAELSREICGVLDGNVEKIKKRVMSEMEAASEALEFERAADLRDKLRALEQIENKQRAPVSQTRNADYISYNSNGVRTCVFMLRIRNGYIIGERCDIFKEDYTPELLSEYIERFYSEDTLGTRGIYIPEKCDRFDFLNEWLDKKLKTAHFNSDRELLDLCRKNATERLLQAEGKDRRARRALEAFCLYTGIKKADYIEIYDVSMLAGTDVVCGCVGITDGAFCKDRYRKFKIGKYEGRDDTAFMAEAVHRRICRYIEKDEKFMPLPDLIICDGGAGQIHAVENAVRSCGIDLPVIGLKKDSKHKTKSVVFPDGRELLLSRDPEAFAFCGRIQEEVHRFAVSYHKNLREKSSGLKNKKRR